MEIVKESIDDLNAVIKVHLNPEDLKPRVMTKLKEVAGKVSLKGFRAGKVPVSVVKKMYGKGVMYEELNSTLSESLQGYIDENKLNLLGRPIPRMKEELDLDLSFKTAYDFEYEIGLAPEFEVSYDLKDLRPLYDIEIDGEYLDREVDNMLDRMGEMTNPEVSEAGDIVFGKVAEVVAEEEAAEETPEGEEAEEKGLSKMAALNPKHLTNKKLIKAIVGKKPEDVFPIKMKDFLKDDEEVRRFWELNVSGQKERELSDDELKDILKKKYTFEVKKINRIAPAELNEEFYTKAFPGEEIADEAAFREKVAGDNKKFYEREAERYFSAKSVDAMILANPLPLPDTFLRKFLVESNENVTEDNIEDHYDNYSKSLVWSLIVGKIQEANPDVKVEKTDVEEQARFLAQTQYAQFTQGGNEQLIESLVQYQMQDQKTYERLFYDALDKKISSFILETVAPAKEGITATAFLEKLKEKEK